MAVDLHIHTTASDGSLTHEEIIDLAISSGLDAIAITDHDTIEAVKPAIAAAHDRGLEVVPGVELGGIHNNTDVHVLGYFIDIENKDLNNFLALHRDHRIKRAAEMTRRLQSGGLDISHDEVVKISGPGSTGRLHIAKLLVEKGYVESINDAFSKLIGKHSKYYVQKTTASLEQIIDIIHLAGGMAVLAHPKTLHDDGMVRRLAVDMIDGIEVYHFNHFPSDITRYQKIAQKRGLVITGGSDFHGLASNTNHSDRLAEIPNSYLEELRALKEKKFKI